MAEIGVHMTCSIRYYRPGKREDAGLLIIANESEFADLQGTFGSVGLCRAGQTGSATVRNLGGEGTVISRGFPTESSRSTGHPVRPVDERPSCGAAEFGLDLRLLPLR